jgi:alpha-L-arabinofuranosidase
LTTRIEHGPTTLIQPSINGITRTNPLTLPLIRAFAYREDNSYAVMVFNLHWTASQTIQLRLPGLPQATATLHTLTASNVYSDNEESEQVQIITTPITNFAQNYQLSLAPHSAYVLEWHGVGIKPALYLPIVRN